MKDKNYCNIECIGNVRYKSYENPYIRALQSKLIESIIRINEIASNDILQNKSDLLQFEKDLLAMCGVDFESDK